MPPNNNIPPPLHTSRSLQYLSWISFCREIQPMKPKRYVKTFFPLIVFLFIFLVDDVKIPEIGNPYISLHKNIQLLAS